MHHFPLTNFHCKLILNFQCQNYFSDLFLALSWAFLLLCFVKDQRHTHHHRKRALFAKGMTTHRTSKKCYEILYSWIFSTPNAHRFRQATQHFTFLLENPSVLWKGSVFGITTFFWCRKVTACLLKLFGTGEHINPHPLISNTYQILEVPMQLLLTQQELKFPRYLPFFAAEHLWIHPSHHNTIEMDVYFL